MTRLQLVQDTGSLVATDWQQRGARAAFQGTASGGRRGPRLQLVSDTGSGYQQVQSTPAGHASPPGGKWATAALAAASAAAAAVLITTGYVTATSGAGERALAPVAGALWAWEQPRDRFPDQP